MFPFAGAVDAMDQQWNYFPVFQTTGQVSRGNEECDQLHVFLIAGYVCPRYNQRGGIRALHIAGDVQPRNVQRDKISVFHVVQVVSYGITALVRVSHVVGGVSQQDQRYQVPLFHTAGVGLLTA